VLGERVDPLVHAEVVELAARLELAALPGVREIVPGYATLTVFFDPATANAEALRGWLMDAGREVGRPGGREVGRSGTTIRIPVRYDGPDLDFVAARTGLTRSEVIERHTARDYRVYLLGFAPGFAYLGDLDPRLILPRRAEPRTRVPAGSVAIAGAQTAVYPLGTPGGWHLLGRTTLRLFDPARDPPVLLHPGDQVRFQAIGSL
jgi:KipI family sensor histidine kinase inhibitor